MKSYSNPLSNIQAYQQAPNGVAGLNAPQQAQPAPDQSQLGDLIQRLQDNGATPDQIRGFVQQIQQNGGNIPQQGDIMQGGTGNDNIADNAPQQSPLSQSLNQIASGTPDVNYDQVNASYPTLRPMQQLSQQDLIALNMSRDSNGGAAGVADRAYQLSKQQQLEKQNEALQALNQRDVNAYNNTIGLAKEAGTIQSQQDKINQMADYRDMQNQINQQKADIAQARADAYQQSVDQRGAGGNNIRKLPVGTQNAINMEIDRQLGIVDAKGRPIENAPNPLLDTQRAMIADEVTRQMQNSTDISVPGAVANAFAKVGGLDKLQEQTKPGKFFGTNSTGYRMFPDVSGVTPQTAPNVSSTNPVTAPPVAATQAPSAGGLTPAQMEVAVQSAIKQGASASDVQKIADKWGVDIDSKTGKVTPKGWQ